MYYHFWVVLKFDSWLIIQWPLITILDGELFEKKICYSNRIFLWLSNHNNSLVWFPGLKSVCKVSKKHPKGKISQLTFKKWSNVIKIWKNWQGRISNFRTATNQDAFLYFGLVNSDADPTPKWGFGWYQSRGYNFGLYRCRRQRNYFCGWRGCGLCSLSKWWGCDNWYKTWKKMLSNLVWIFNFLNFFPVTTDSLGSHFLSAADTVTKIEIDDDNIGEMTIMNPTSGGASTSKAIKKGMKLKKIICNKNCFHVISIYRRQCSRGRKESLFVAYGQWHHLWKNIYKIRQPQKTLSGES